MKELILFSLLLFNCCDLNAKTVDDLTLMLYQVDDRNGVIKVLEDKPNREVILDAGVERIRLDCRAPFPVQWIYSGAGVPTLSSTIRKESEAKFLASAFITSVREHHTGKYDCIGTENPQIISSYLFIYVPGSTIFTTMGGTPIYIPKNDSHVRVPCGVSNPKVLVVLEKSVGDVLVPVKSTTNYPAYTYDPKVGFDLDLKNVQEPEGNYVCTAIGKGFRKTVEFNIGYHPSSPYYRGTYKKTPSPVPSNIIDGQLKCGTHTDCPPNMSCYTDLTCKDPCVNSIRCGERAICKYKDHRPYCECPKEYFQGDPMKECYNPTQGSSNTNKDHNNKPPGDDPSVYVRPSTIPKPPGSDECRENRDCAKIQTCIKGKCIDPCALKICDPNAFCVTDANRIAMCICNPGYNGQNGRNCAPEKLQVEPIVVKPQESNTADFFNLKITTKENSSICKGTYCGPNSECKATEGGHIQCKCKEGYNGDPPKCGPKCVHNKECPSDTICRSNLGSYPDCVEVCDERICGLNAACKEFNVTKEVELASACLCKEGFTGDPYIECKPIPQAKDCLIDNECSETERCETGATYRKCVNPCSRFECPYNTECKVVKHYPVCECPKGFTGSPLVGCTKDALHKSTDFFLPIQVTTESAVELQSTAATSSPVNNCSSFTCGPNSECRIVNSIPKCFCQSNYIGEPPHCRLECDNNSECPIDRACIQKRCRNPCRNKCGDNARCKVTPDDNRSAVCNCRNGFFGDPYLRCNPVRDH